MFIKNFYCFTNESYLKSGRAPIYHFTTSYRLKSIVNDDILKTSKPSRSSHGKDRSISLTRCIDFISYGNEVCFELDSDKLLKDGYRIYPVDEWAWKDGLPNKDNFSRNFNKSKFSEVKSGRRGTKHKLDLPKNPILETEFEERIYKDIINLGKYIIKIYIKDDYKLEYIKEYLNKYKHITINSFYESDIRKSKDVTNFVKNIHNDYLVR